MLVDGLVVCPVNLACQIIRFHYPKFTQQTQNDNPADTNHLSIEDELHFEKLGCYLTAIYNGATVTTTSPVLLFLCVERALLVIWPVDGKIFLKRFRLRMFVTVNIGTSVLYTLLLYLGTNYDVDEQMCNLTLLGFSRIASGYLVVILFYIIPLAAMIILYPLIVDKLLRNKVPLPENRIAMNKRVSSLLITSTAAFSFLWAPVMIPSLWQAIDTESWNKLCMNQPFIFKLYVVGNLFILLYSVVNPCIFALITRPIREPLFQGIQSQAFDLIGRQKGFNPKGSDKVNVNLDSATDMLDNNVQHTSV
ncbi:uncharacterized protein LOC142345411 isoform X2 [Convolutriloba macropyga]